MVFTKQVDLKQINNFTVSSCEAYTCLFRKDVESPKSISTSPPWLSSGANAEPEEKLYSFNELLSFFSVFVLSRIVSSLKPDNTENYCYIADLYNSQLRQKGAKRR